MDTKSYPRGTVIFRQGDSGDCMYEIQNGAVGIYYDYKGPHEKEIAHLTSSDIFGEMGLLDRAPRSATAVILEEDTVLTLVTERDFYTYFEKNPAKVLQMMDQMCIRLRNTTSDYLNACRTVYETVEAEKSGKKKSETLLDKIKKLCDFYSGFNFYGEV